MTGPGPYHQLVKRLRRQERYLLPILRIKLKLIWTTEFVQTCNAFCGSAVTQPRGSKVPAVRSRLPWLQVQRPQLAECLAGAPHRDPVTTQKEFLEPERLALPGEGSFSLPIQNAGLCHNPMHSPQTCWSCGRLSYVRFWKIA